MKQEMYFPYCFSTSPFCCYQRYINYNSVNKYKNEFIRYYKNVGWMEVTLMRTMMEKM